MSLRPTKEVVKFHVSNADEANAHTGGLVWNSSRFSLLLFLISQKCVLVTTGFIHLLHQTKDEG